MSDTVLTHDEKVTDSTVVLGFWIYLMTDFILFAGLFATFLVLRTNTVQGPTLNANLSFALVETILLLTSSFLAGMALLAARANSVRSLMTWLVLAGALGAAFIGMEISEFTRLVASGNGPTRSGFLSSYFTLVGTHGLHVTIGLLWLIALIISIAMRGLTRANMRKLVLWSLFWHFLDIVWIFIFTIVYLMGAV
ncbi:MAG TPA: cytochrome (ubi)quinol oxidase subunit III [Candidatus Paceibacterota bacterium]|nr:cytochrome (ubi)quinol oxidase subunit III [Candidatus Paceibacterota bacterium]